MPQGLLISLLPVIWRRLKIRLHAFLEDTSSSLLIEKYALCVGDVLLMCNKYIEYALCVVDL